MHGDREIKDDKDELNGKEKYPVFWKLYLTFFLHDTIMLLPGLQKHCFKSKRTTRGFASANSQNNLHCSGVIRFIFI